MGWLALGLLAGGLNGWTQHWTVMRRRPEAAGRAIVWTLAGAVLRWLLAAALLLVAVQQSAVAGLLVVAGMMIARWALILRWHGRAGISRAQEE